jgi:peptidoglycan/LPS O-acetylase OafA/YrhL
MDGAGWLESGGRATADLKPLTALRFAAAMLVVLAHWDLSAHHVPARFGAAGVAFFFVLSGFILTHVYAGRFARFPSARAARSFWLARFARIYPLHLLTLVFVAVLGPAKIEADLYAFALGAQLLLVQAWIPVAAVPYAFNGPAWTLSDEAFFYALFPFALRLLLRTRPSVPKLLVTMAAVWLTAGAFDLSTDALQPAMQWLIYVFPVPRLAEFSCGMMLGLVFARSKVTLTARTATIVESAALAFVAFAVGVSDWLPPAYGFAACALPAWCLLIFVFAQQRGAVSRLLSAPPLVLLGEASFSLYLVHHIVMDKLNGVPALALSFALALAVHRFVEVPAREAMRERCDANPQPQPLGLDPSRTV